MVSEDAARTRLGAVNAALRALTLASKLVLLVVLGRTLATAQVGVFGLITATLAFAVQLVGLEYHQFNSRELVARPTNEWPRLLRDQLVLCGPVYLVALPSLLLGFVVGGIPWRYAGWCYLLLPLEHLSQELYRVLVVRGRPLRANTILFLRSGSWCYAACVWLWLAPGAGLADVLAWWSLGSALSVGLGGLWLADLPWRAARAPTDWSWIRRGLRTAVPFLGMALIARATALDRYALELFRDHATVGVYAFYGGLALGVQAALEAAVVSVALPALLRAGAADAAAQLEALVARFARALAGWTLALAAVAALAIHLVVGLLDRPAYAAQLGVFWVLLANVVVVAAMWVPHYGLFAARRDRPLLVGSVVGLVVMVAADAVLVPRAGALGAAWGLVAGSVASAVLKSAAFRGELTRRRRAST
jgi:O-antigen/teichoic acid export membrane protein